MKLAAFIFIIALAIPSAHGQEVIPVPQKVAPTSEQKVFSEEVPLSRPVPLSSEVLKVLLATEEAKEAFVYMRDSEKE